MRGGSLPRSITRAHRPERNRHGHLPPGDRDEIRRGLGVGDETLLVCAGRLDPLKGTSVAVRALELASALQVRMALVVLGAGWTCRHFRRSQPELRLGDAIDFVPPQPHEALAKWLAAADAFLFPTQLNEAAPLVPLQAMACATPVIASDVGTLREMIGSTNCGWSACRPARRASSRLRSSG